MKKALLPAALAVAMAVGLAIIGLVADDDHDKAKFQFHPGSLVLSRSVYEGVASTVMVGEVLPLGCVQKSTFVLNTNVTTPATITVSNTSCGKAVNDGTYPGVWNNDGADGSFGVTSPIFLDNVTTDGKLLDTLPIDPKQIVTSFSSKSEVALNLADDRKSITFMGYRGGPGCDITFSGTGGLVGSLGTVPNGVSPTEPNLLDVSNSNTPGVCDPTNPVVSSDPSNPTTGTAYYRTVAEVNAHGQMWLTEGNAYSGNNGRAVAKAGWLYYAVGNDNNGALSTKTDSSGNGLVITNIGVNLVNSTGAELLVPGQTPPTPPNINKIGDFEITQVGYTKADKAGKDNNFRGLTLHKGTMYFTKGSGGNGINTVYETNPTGTLPTLSTAAATKITIVPGFPTSLASGVDQNGNAAPVAFPFGLWFANDSTLYVCDEGDGTLEPAVAGNVASTYSQINSGVQKWILASGTWKLAYVLNSGLNIGVPYSIPNYPTTLNPAPDGCRNMTGRVNKNGTVTIWAITSTVSANGDQGADPNQLITVTDDLNATKLPTSGNPHDEKVTVLRSARYGEVLRGVSLAPSDAGRDDDDHGDRDGQ